MKTHFKFNLNGINLKVSSKFIRTVNGETVIYMDHVPTASVIKQYVKSKYPNVVVSTKSDSFSGGNSVDVYISDEKGQPVTEKIESDIKSFAKMFQYGNFNGMIDMYEYSNTNLSTDEGIEIDFGTKYISVQNRAKFGTKEGVMADLIKYTTLENNRLNRTMTMDEAITEMKKYCKSDVVLKAAEAL